MYGKLLAVIWKNFLIRRNAWLMTLYELLFPLGILFAINFWLPPMPTFHPPDSSIILDDNWGFEYGSQMLYSPSNTFTDSLIDELSQRIGYKRNNIIAGNMAELINGTYNYGIDFGDSHDGYLKYTIYPGSGIWPSSLSAWLDDSSAIRHYHGRYGTANLAELQYKVDRVFIEYTFGKSGFDLPTPPKIIAENMDRFSRETSPYGIFVVLAIFVSYSLLVSPVITRIVEEKECGAKELMRMMGVTSWQLWLGKLVDSVFISTLVVTGMVILLYVPLTETSTVIHFVHPLIFFIMLLLGMTAVIIGLFCLSCFFDSPVFASSVASIIGIGSAFLLGFLQMTSVAYWRRLLYCLLPHMTIISSAHILTKFEQYGKEVNWFERLDTDGSMLSLAEVLIMMIVDIVLYSILTWYFDKIKPGKYGIPMPWHFFAHKNYWCAQVITKSEINLLRNTADGRPRKPGISVHQLRKVYKEVGQEPVVAVDCLNVDVPEGNITALLGHNGAGKTTTMQIITGLITATSGTVNICGYDIRTNPDEARASLGLCPQQDLLFQNLTSLQTLTFFAMIKGLSYKNGRKEAETLLEKLKMKEAKDKLNKDLSGGMKRKVSLGIALIGGSKVLILDEPTAGVDAELRREICDLLLSYRGERTVLLTTHIMEEADAISDLIFIMDHGKIQCSGTPLDLKTKFGTGYTLQVVTNKDDVAVKDLVKKTVPDSRFKARNAATMYFQLPSIQTPVFPSVFGQLDNMQAAGEIVSYSLSISTLEDVFIRVREIETEAGTDEVDGTPYHLLSSNIELNPGRVTGFHLWATQFWAIFIKAAITFKRSWLPFLGFAGIPFALIILSELVAPLLLSMNSSSTVHEIAKANYSDRTYSQMEIYRYNEGCPACGTFEEDFTSIISERGFRPIYDNDVDEAILLAFNTDFNHYARQIALGVKVTKENISIRYNSQATNMLSVAVNLIHNTILRRANSSIVTAANLRYVSEIPEMFTPDPTSQVQTDGSFLDIIGFQSLYYLTAMQTERRTGAKALQLMAAPACIYWVSHFAFDIIAYIPFISVASLAYYFFEPNDIIFTNSVFPVAVVLWGGGLILVSYVITCFIKTKSNAVTVAILVYFVGCNILWTFIETGLIPDWPGYFHPSTMWKLGMRNRLDSGWHSYLLVLASYWLVMIVFLVLIESTIPSRVIHSLLSRMCTVKYNSVGVGETDIDVDAEDEQVTTLMLAPQNAHDTLIVSRLRRWYGLFRPRPAVRGVSFRVQPGECFGLLGVNGAGKSSTFNMLTTQIACSGGDAVLNKAYLSSWNTNEYLSQVSYCPQTSGIIPNLTGSEFLTLFARLRGYREQQVSDIVYHWIRVLDLAECSERLCGRYSGGMERKLIAAAAFLWDAAVVMLDEPTSGVDPVARRSIWKAVTSAQQAQKCVVLTSHSMEECEALCSRLAIMVDGSFRCLGETTTLKNKFGGGYSVQIKVSPCNVEEMTAFEKAVTEALGRGCLLTDRHCSILHYHIASQTTSWKSLFSQLEKLKSRYEVLESYIASETTLEQIFLDFAGHRKVKVFAETVVEISE